MSIYVRQAKYSDKEKAVYVEGQSTPNLRYLSRMWDSFVESVDEPLFIAFYEGEMAGVGKLSILYDGSAWLETLRVDKKFQGRGIGKAIYKAYLDHAKKLGISELRMYTNHKNAASAGLAKINGFSLAGQYSGADLNMTNYIPPNEIAAFEKITDNSLAYELLEPLGKKWDNHMIFNRTFYPFNKSLVHGLTCDASVYYHKHSESVLVYGARFMPDRGMNIGMFSGNSDLCLDFAAYMTYMQDLPKLSIMFPPQLDDVKSALLKKGYTMQPEDCIVMERLFSK
jgi:RimJ/RimL family protein N-acetyltransferase